MNCRKASTASRLFRSKDPFESGPSTDFDSIDRKKRMTYYVMSSFHNAKDPGPETRIGFANFKPRGTTMQLRLSDMTEPFVSIWLPRNTLSEIAVRLPWITATLIRLSYDSAIISLPRLLDRNRQYYLDPLIETMRLNLCFAEHIRKDGTVVVCAEDGKPLRPFWIRDDRPGDSRTQAWFPAQKSLVTVCRRLDGTVEITRRFIVRDQTSPHTINLEKAVLRREHPSDIPGAFAPFDDAVAALLQKVGSGDRIRSFYHLKRQTDTVTDSTPATSPDDTLPSRGTQHS